MCYILKKYLIIIALVLTVLSCRLVRQTEVLVKNPKPEKPANYRTSTFQEPFFQELHFGYAENTQIDSAKHFYTSETIIDDNGRTFYLRNCSARLSQDSIFLQLSDLPFSQNSYELRLLKVNNELKSNYYQTFSIGDSSYRLPVFKTIEQNMVLDKPTYKTGDSIKCKIAVRISAFNTWDIVYTDTIKIFGLIKTKID